MQTGVNLIPQWQECEWECVVFFLYLIKICSQMVNNPTIQFHKQISVSCMVASHRYDFIKTFSDEMPFQVVRCHGDVLINSFQASLLPGHQPSDSDPTQGEKYIMWSHALKLALSLSYQYTHRSVISKTHTWRLNSFGSHLEQSKEIFLRYAGQYGLISKSQHSFRFH